ncbi:hypothetical protein [Anaerocolumna sp. MB42-C2]|uniref:hypothetical protein n=1 Tax=Anaerocolumna sp. MB42-C2 TaxID=3070997 RepID=UPI0027DF6E7D|nr:hypothetical protein [Anaerocolumna sp. MB42-C2]WMJ87103.1 hypothetical protein RBU59_24185 [Anaerocolumna sp. MB42-C2]
MIQKKKDRITIIILSIFYITIGLGFLFGGASSDIRFYAFDNLFIRINGIFLIVSCIGLLFKKEIARKGIILSLVLAVVEIFIGVPKESEIQKMINDICIMLMIYVPGLIYFIVIKNRNYFN